jgi:hypothetical protein
MQLFGEFMSALDQFPVVLNQDMKRVIAGLVPTTAIVEAQYRNNRGGRDKPGHDGAGKCFDMTGICSNKTISAPFKCAWTPG